MNKYKDIEAMWIRQTDNQALTDEQRAQACINIFMIDKFWKVSMITIDEVYSKFMKL